MDTCADCDGPIASGDELEIRCECGDYSDDHAEGQCRVCRCAAYIASRVLVCPHCLSDFDRSRAA